MKGTNDTYERCIKILACLESEPAMIGKGTLIRKNGYRVGQTETILCMLTQMEPRLFENNSGQVGLVGVHNDY